METFSFDGDNRAPHAIAVLPNGDVVLVMLPGGRSVEVVLDADGRVLSVVALALCGSAGQRPH